MFLIKNAWPKNERPLDYVILKIALILLTVHCAQPLRADDDPDSWICKVKELIKDPKITSRNDFWERFGAASTDEAAAKKLYLELKNNKTPEASKPVVPSIPIAISKKFQKDYDKLPPVLRAKADLIIAELKKGKEGFDRVIATKSYEGHLLQPKSAKEWELKLDEGYRFIFSNRDGKIELILANNEPYRH